MNTKSNIATKKRVSPKDVFMHLLAIIALYFSAASFLTLLFQYINYWLPDRLFMGDISVNNGPLRFALASLVIVFPVFIVTSWFLHKEYRRNSSARQMRLRKWLIYFTLFAATVIMCGDLVSVVYNFLEGELTLRFLLKALAVMIVAGVIFSYYLWDVRQAQPSAKMKYFAWPVIVCVTIGVIGGFFLAGSPQEQRLYREDQERISNLQQIHGAVVMYWQEQRMLPVSLAAMSAYLNSAVTQDPATGTLYDYTVQTDTTYEICATFAKASTETDSMYAAPAKFNNDNWNHPAGRHCFSRELTVPQKLDK